MTISNTFGYFAVIRLHSHDLYVTMQMCHTYRKDGSHDSDPERHSYFKRGSGTTSLVRRNSAQTLTQQRDTRLQSWEVMAHQIVRVGAIYRGTKEKIASTEAQNVRSLLSNLSGKLLDNRPRNHTATYCSRLYPFVHIVLTVSSVCQVRLGGKCDVV